MAFSLIRKLLGAPTVTERQQHLRSSASGAGRLFELSCMCAVTENPYLLQYERGTSGKLRFLKSIKGDAANQHSNGSPASRAASWPVDSFEPLTFPCPWCGSNAAVLCGACRKLVCGGRTVGNVFHCGRRCGAYGVPETLPSVSGTARNGADLLSSASKSPELGPGTSLVKV